jgi:hypothetical protein
MGCGIDSCQVEQTATKEHKAAASAMRGAWHGGTQHVLLQTLATLIHKKAKPRAVSSTQN